MERLAHKSRRDLAVQRVLPVFAFGHYEVSRVKPSGFAYQRRNYIGTQTLTVAYDGIKGFLAQIVNEEHSVVYAAQLFEHPVHGVE